MEGETQPVLYRTYCTACTPTMNNKQHLRRRAEIRCLVNEQAILTEDCGDHLETEQLIVLEKFDERERQQRKIIRLSKDGGPVGES